MNPFVSPPYKQCPKCCENFFGILSIGERFYSRRCAKCDYPRPRDGTEDFPLPELNKKVIYLDQFVISNMVKALHPEEKRQVDPFFFEAFKKLDRLSKLQLIVCPDSEFHEDESVFLFPREHKRVYELLSHGTSYLDRWTILRLEIFEHLENWLKATSTPNTSLKVHEVIHGKINAWQDRLLITVNSNRTDGAKDQLKSTKEASFEALKQAFSRWESEKNKRFEYWYQEELSQWKWSLFDSYQKYIKTMVEVSTGIRAFNPVELMPTPFYLIFSEITKKIKENSKSHEEYKEMLNKFLEPESLENTPFIRLFSMLFATVAHRVSSGNMKSEKLKPSFFSDVMMVSTLLPFCDAIFLERQVAGFLRDNPLSTAISPMPLVFSLSSKKEFFEYLDKIEQSASKEHLDLVGEVYGTDWGQPYCNVLKDELKD